MQRLSSDLNLPKIGGKITAFGHGDGMTWRLEFDFRGADARYAPGYGYVAEEEVDDFIIGFKAARDSAEKVNSVDFNGDYKDEISWGKRFFDTDVPKLEIITQDGMAMVRFGVYSKNRVFFSVAFAPDELDNVIGMLSGVAEIGANLVDSLKQLRGVN